MDRLGRTLGRDRAAAANSTTTSASVPPGRKPFDDRKALCGILFVLYIAIPWEHLPQELGFGSGMTCWRRLRDWNDAGVWQQLHEILLGKLRAAGRLDMSRAVIDGSHIRALKGGPKRAEPGRPPQAGLETPRPHGRGRHSTRCGSDRRQPSRRHPADVHDRRNSADPGRSWPSPAATRQAVRRPGLRLRLLPPPASGQGHLSS